MFRSQGTQGRVRAKEGWLESEGGGEGGKVGGGAGGGGKGGGGVIKAGQRAEI